MKPKDKRLRIEHVYFEIISHKQTVIQIRRASIFYSNKTCVIGTLGLVMWAEAGAGFEMYADADAVALVDPAACHLVVPELGPASEPGVVSGVGLEIVDGEAHVQIAAEDVASEAFA
jgi:hypothetical protein